MKLNRTILSPNTTDVPIKVEFIVIHYTATSLDRTLEIFRDPKTKASSHFVIAENGEIFELVPALEKDPIMAHHAGRSKLNDINEFNECAIGIELVNLNGNIFPYSDLQYQALTELILKLKERYPALKSPERIIGHEQISGYRGKIDPGWMFDWQRIFKEAYPGMPVPTRAPLLSDTKRKELEKALAKASKTQDYEEINLKFEKN